MTTYSLVKALHVMAVLVAYGLPLAAPLLVPYLRRHHPRALPGVHDAQHRLNLWLTGPGTVLLFGLGVYMASSHHLWGATWVMVPLAIVVVIAVAGAWVVRATATLARLARRDVERAPQGAVVAWGDEYETLYHRYLAVEALLGVLVLVAVAFMVAKPFA